MSRFNRQFCVQAGNEGTAFVPLLTTQLDDILCLKAERYVKAKVRVHEYQRGYVAVFHGP